jgi:hypothetical protein
MALQEILAFKEDENKIVHFFINTDSLFKCEEGFYSVGQILDTKDKELDWIWILIILLTLGLTMLFNIYVCPTKVIFRFFYGN